MRSLRPLLLSLALAACGSPTQLVVVVDSDYEVPVELAGAEASAMDQDGETVGAASFDLASIGLPMSFGIEPTGDLVDEEIRVSVRGLAPSGALLVERSAVVGFVAGERRLLAMFLAKSCTGVVCPAAETCTEHGCDSVSVDVEGLREIEPGGELDYDAGVHPDAGAPVRDAGLEKDAEVEDADVEDADPEDANVEEDARPGEDALPQDAMPTDGADLPDLGPPDATPPPCLAGSDCEDGDLCTQGDTCDQNGACIPGSPVLCPIDDSPCTVESCNPQTGACEIDPAPPFTTCDDFDVCSDGDFCQGTTCVGGPAIVCPDDMSYAESCMEAFCDPSAGCRTRPLPDLSVCQGQSGEHLCCGGQCFDTSIGCCGLQGSQCCFPIDQCHFDACNGQGRCAQNCCP